MCIAMGLPHSMSALCLSGNLHGAALERKGQIKTPALLRFPCIVTTGVFSFTRGKRLFLAPAALSLVVTASQVYVRRKRRHAYWVYIIDKQRITNCTEMQLAPIRDWPRLLFQQLTHFYASAVKQESDASINCKNSSNYATINY